MTTRQTRMAWAAASLVLVGSLAVAGTEVVTTHDAGVAATHRAGTDGRTQPTHKVLVSTDNLPADCIPNPVGPPTAPYQLGLVGTVHGGVLNAGAATVANINVTFCGVVTLTNGRPPCGATGTVVSPPDGQVYGPLSVDLTRVPGMSPSVGFTANPATITGGFTCTTTPSPN